jgi:hypothetical protein
MISTEPLLRELKAITDYLDSIDPQWREKIATKGASGSMTPAEAHSHDDEIIGYVWSIGDFANVRCWTKAVTFERMLLAFGQ